MKKINELSFIGAREIYESKKYPITKNILFARIKKGQFPKPMKTTNAFHWLKTDIDAFFKKNP